MGDRTTQIPTFWHAAVTPREKRALWKRSGKVEGQFNERLDLKQIRRKPGPIQNGRSSDYEDLGLRLTAFAAARVEPHS
jgi:hypothetical protein